LCDTIKVKIRFSMSLYTSDIIIYSASITWKSELTYQFQKEIRTHEITNISWIDLRRYLFLKQNVGWRSWKWKAKCKLYERSWILVVLYIMHHLISSYLIIHSDWRVFGKMGLDHNEHSSQWSQFLLSSLDKINSMAKLWPGISQKFDSLGAIGPWTSVYTDSKVLNYHSNSTFLFSIFLHQLWKSTFHAQLHFPWICVNS